MLLASLKTVQLKKLDLLTILGLAMKMPVAEEL